MKNKSPKSSGYSCLERAPIPSGAAAATLYIKADAKQGSGFVVANSATAGRANRILTAQHVIYPESGEPAQQNVKVINVYDSTGTHLGKAKVIATGGWEFGSNPTDEQARNLGQNDIAVLEIQNFASPETERTYRAIRGIPLAPKQSANAMDFNLPLFRQRDGFGNIPPSPSAGASGSPVLNKSGMAIGLMQSAKTPPYANPNSKVPTYGNMDKKIALKEPLRAGDVMTRQHYSHVIASISNTTILESLGTAGKRVKLFNLTVDQKIAVSTAGFSEGHCTAFKGSVFNSKARRIEPNKPQPNPN